MSSKTPLSKLASQLSRHAETFGSVEAVSFKASHILEHLLPDGTVNSKKPGYTRTIEGTLSGKGMFRIEIEYTKGPATGTKFFISFDGGRTYLVTSSVSRNYLATKKGKLEPISYLFFAISPLEPFAFLDPARFDPNDQGSYLTLDELVRKGSLSKWFDGAAAASNADLAGDIRVEKKIKLPGDRELLLDLFLQELTSLPSRIEAKIEGHRESRDFSWKDISLPNGKSIPVATGVVIEQAQPDGTRKRMYTTIQDVSFPLKVSVDFWKYDLKKATSIFDGDQNKLVPASAAEENFRQD